MRLSRRELVVWTIGHSTHPIAEFVDLLRQHGITLLIDVRTMPRSRHNPQFSQEALAASLGSASIAYRHEPGLGGLRRPRADSVNTGWRNTSFRGYADYMQTPEFESNLNRLMELSAAQPTAIMCAEAVQWRCHRSLVADALTVRGVEVEHIQSSGRTQVHRMTPFALVQGHRITYPEVTHNPQLSFI